MTRCRPGRGRLPGGGGGAGVSPGAKAPGRGGLLGCGAGRAEGPAPGASGPHVGGPRAEGGSRGTGGCLLSSACHPKAYTDELVELHRRLMALRERNVLQQVWLRPDAPPLRCAPPSVPLPSRCSRPMCPAPPLPVCPTQRAPPLPVSPPDVPCPAQHAGSCSPKEHPSSARDPDNGHPSRASCPLKPPHQLPSRL